jgi:hypothetical protein
MVIGFDNGIVMRDDDLITADDRDYVGATRQLDVFDFSADNIRFFRRTVCDGFYCFRGATTQRMHFDDIATANVRQ